MKQTLSLVWKEWRESRAYLFIGLGIFLGLPLIGGVEDWFTSTRHFQIETMPWITCFGGALAVFAAVGATCRDFSGRMEDFWRAVPVSVARWMAAKYGMGLMIVSSACAIPIAVEAAISPRSDTFIAGVLLCVFFIGVYSIAFAAGCLLRRTAQAAMMGLAGMLLLWFVPILLPPLGWMTIDFDDGNGNPRWLGFAGSVLGLGAAGFVLATVAVRQNWQIESGRKLIYASISATLILLLASASFQLGTNLPILQQVDLPPKDMLQWINFDGLSGQVQSSHRFTYTDPVSHGTKDRDVVSFHKLQITPAGMKLGDSFQPDPDMWLHARRDVVLPDRSIIQYIPGAGDESSYPAKGPLQLTINHHTEEGIRISKEKVPFQLWSLDRDQNYDWNTDVWKNRLYVTGFSNRQATDQLDHATRLAIIDISDPLKPKLLSNTPFVFSFMRYVSVMRQESFAEEKVAINLPPYPNVPGRERLKMVLFHNRAFEDDTLCMQLRNSIVKYHLDSITDHLAIFTKVAEYKFSTVQQLCFGLQNRQDLQLLNGLVYELDGANFQNSCMLNVFDARELHSLRLVGHFAAPGAWYVRPLPDGRAIVGGEKLWLLGPPPDLSH